MKRNFTAPPNAERCRQGIRLRDGSTAQCMRRATYGDGLCSQHHQMKEGKPASPVLAPPPACNHDPFGIHEPTTLRVESNPADGVRLRCTVCNRTAKLNRHHGKIVPAGTQR